MIVLIYIIGDLQSVVCLLVIRKMNDILNDVYYNTSSPACYAGLTAVYKEAKHRNENIKRGDVEKFMHEQEVYT